MPARGKVSLDGTQYEKKLDELKSKTVKATGDMSKSVKDFGKDVGSAGKALGMVAGDVGSKFGALGKTIGALASGPIALLTAAIGAMVAMGVKLWDTLTVSAEEYMTKLDATAKIQEKNLATLEKEQAAEDKYMDRLNELSEKESLSNAEKDEAAFLIMTLTERYGELGIEIDGVTGKIKNLTQAEETLNVKQRQKKMASLEERIKTELARSEQGYRVKLNSGVLGTIDDWLGNNRMEVQRYRDRGLEGRIEFANKSLKNATTKEDLDFWSQEIDRLQKIKDLTDELNNLREFGQESKEKQAEVLEKASEKEVSAIEKATEAQRKLIEAEEKATEAFQKELAAARELEKKERERKEQYLVGQVMPLRDAALRASGRGKQADLDAAVWQATTTKGSALTEDEYARVIEMATAKHDLNIATRGMSGGLDYAPRVNSLVARGGSEAPVAMPKVEELQNKTFTAVEKIETACEKILSSIDDWLTT